MLRSASRILGYRLSARDGEVGRCVDLLLEPQTWNVRYVVVDAGVRVPGGRVLISPASLRKVEWTSRRWVLDGIRAELESEPSSAPALQSLEQLLGFGLDDNDGNVGYVEDLIVDDDSWHCRYLLINGEFRLSGRKALVPTAWLGQLHPSEHRVEAPVPRARIASAPEFRPDVPLGNLEEGSSPAATEPTSSPESTATASLPPAWRFNAPRAWAQAAAWKKWGEWGSRGLKAALHRTLQGR
jgi:hypothetical protein